VFDLNGKFDVLSDGVEAILASGAYMPGLERAF